MSILNVKVNVIFVIFVCCFLRKEKSATHKHNILLGRDSNETCTDCKYLLRLFYFWFVLVFKCRDNRCLHNFCVILSLDRRISDHPRLFVVELEISSSLYREEMKYYDH